MDLLQYLNGETQYLYSLLSLSQNGAAPPSDRLVNAEMALEALANVIRHNRGKGSFINVTDKVVNFVEELYYSLNCILKIVPRPVLFPKKV